jgi:predicted TIM-barrel fold metal-dependent hydrolase
MTTQTSTQTTDNPPFFGRAIDCDTHEMIPFHMWGEYFGEEVADVLKPLEHNRYFNDNGRNSIVRPDITADDREISEVNVWNDKGPDAPGAFDLRRRAEVLDVMGVSKSLLFPSFGLSALMLRSSPEFAAQVVGLPMSPQEIREAGTRGLIASNYLTIEGVDANRVRQVAILVTESLPEMMAELTKMIERGIRAIWIPTGTPPANTSPADPALDDFWRLAADSNVTVLAHIGTDFTFLSSLMWTANVDAFVPPVASAEFVISPYAGATGAFGIENFLTTMILGGVFERVPNLRFGAVELGAEWFGPFAQRLDLWADVFPKALAGVLSMRPSEYLARNVRVTPYHFEPTERYLQTYPDLASCYCYSSDYPHVEGGADPMHDVYQRIAPLGERIVEQYFVTNGEWLLPDS